VSRKILGISAFYHDAAAALVDGERIVAAAQEERFTRKRHDPRFPVNAINYCLEEAECEASELDAIVFYDNPLLTFDRVLQSCMAVGPEARSLWTDASASLMRNKLWVQAHVEATLRSLGREGRLLFTDHHMSHAASAFYPSPFDEAAILTLDGVGEWSTTSLGAGSGNDLELFSEIDYPHSLGLLYSAFTYYCGFKVNSGEYKLMGLAPYGKPLYADRIREHLIDVKPDGSYRLDLDYFGYLGSDRMTTQAFHRLFEGEPREPESRIRRRDMDLAASIQEVTTEVVMKIAAGLRERTGKRHLVLAGGVALNCVANGELMRAGIFDEIWIQPAAGDAGGALGAALLTAHRYYGLPRSERGDGYKQGAHDSQRGSYLGPAYGPNEIRAYLERHDLPYERIEDPGARVATIADALSQEKVVGHFAGRMEFGPRALGARSILADPRSEKTQSVVNLKIKYRESFRPFAPIALEETAAEYFELDQPSPYMLIVAPVQPSRRKPMESADAGEDVDLLEIVNRPRSELPAITHVDYSARIQTVGPEQLPELHALLRAFEERTGYGVLVNTSFNVRGEPIVCSPKDAYVCFMRTEMDLLVLGDFLLWKDQQPPFEEEGDWRSEYGND
jgi:carbamoyltransferase